MSLDANVLLLSLLVSSIGFVFFAYGKKQGRVPQMVAGLTLMLYPYLVSNLFAMAGIAVGVLAALWGALKLGA